MNSAETIQYIFGRDQFICFVCGDNILGYNKRPQRAHLLSQGKYARVVFGNEVIDSPFNAKATCSLKCNNKLAVNYASKPVLAGKLAIAIQEKDMKTIDKLLNEKLGKK